jgi:hypothetical protein
MALAPPKQRSPSYFAAGSILLALIGCTQKEQPKEPNTKLIYFGLDDRSEKSKDALELAKTWGGTPVCPNWRATVKREAADYQVLFSTAEVSIIDRKGQVLYSGGQGVLYMPHGNPTVAA